MPYAKVIPFAAQIKPSKIWQLWIVFTHLALFAALVFYMPQSLWLIFFYPLTLYLSMAGRAKQIKQVQVSANGKLKVLRANCSEWENAEVMENSFVSNWLIILNLRVNQRKIALLILADSAESDFRRALRVYLRWFALDEPTSNTRQFVDFFKLAK